MIVIADTGPINYLVLIGEIDALPQIYGRILIPDVVCGELSDPRAPEAVRLWIAHPPAWLEVRTPNAMPDSALLAADLDAGERDAILLALELDADEVIIDDMGGRQEAERRHLRHTGTLGVLRAAARAGLLDFKDAVERLRRTNFHIAQDFLEKLIREQEE